MDILNRITAADLRAAIGYLDWERKTLAERSGVGQNAITRLLKDDHLNDPFRRPELRESVRLMVEAIQAAGYVFPERPPV